MALRLSWGARVNETYDDFPDTVLGVAIINGDCAMIEILLQAGATNTERMLTQIGSLEVAKYLDQLGMLSGIVLRYGQPILVSAIQEESLGKGDGLVEYLLDLDVGRTVWCQPCELRAKGYSRFDSFTISPFTISPLAKAISCQNVTLTRILVERGAPVTDHELCKAVKRCYGCENYDFLSLLMPELSRHPYAVPNAFAMAMRNKYTVFLVQ